MMKRIKPLSKISVENYSNQKSKRYMTLERRRSVNLRSSNKRRLNVELERRKKTTLNKGEEGKHL